MALCHGLGSDGSSSPSHQSPHVVAIQLGWGDYSDGAVGTFLTLRVLGSGGRGAEGNAIISGRQGRYRVTVNIDGCHIENPNGTLVSLREDSMTLGGTITNAPINLVIV